MPRRPEPAAGIPVVVNAAAGQGHGASEFKAIADAFRKAGLEVAIHPIQHGARMETVVRSLVRSGARTIVAAGGDGTVSAVAGELVGRDVALGVLPCGTRNHFARDLGVPLAHDEAARVIAEGRTARVDVGEVNGRIFINNSSIGLYPTLVLHRKSQQRRLGRGRWHASFWAALAVARRHPMLDTDLTLDSVKVRRQTPLVFIGNNEYRMRGLRVEARDRLDGGRLSVYLTLRGGRAALARIAWRALWGRLDGATEFEALSAHSARIATRHPRLAVATDGEVTVMDMPLDYRIRPRALQVIVPAKAQAQ